MTTKTTLVALLRETAAQFQDAANDRDDLMDVHALEQTACATRLCALLVLDGIYAPEVGKAWLDAAGRILAAVQTAGGNA
ncbi:MAG: hypothetical protein JWP75_2926 [Frondihabitans sp.]|nr:hypothetical protein [Frondihabitans sp.]